MFAKDKVTKSMLDAVNSVIAEAETKEPTKKKPGWLIDAEKAAEAREGKLKEDSEQLDEIDANAILALAKKVSPTAKIRGSVEDQKKERDAVMAQREKDRPAQAAERRRKDTEELKKQHKPEDIKKQMDDVKKKYEYSHGSIEKHGHQYANGSSYTQGRDLMDKYQHLKGLHKRITEDKDEPFINAVSKVINGEKGVTVEEETSRSNPMYRKHVEKTPGSSFMDKAKSHDKNLPSVIKDLQGERDSVAKERGYKHAMFHDKAIGAFKSAQKILAKEEVEQIDELNRGSLLSYANKVSLDSQKHSKDPTKRSAEKASRSVTGYARAHNRLEKPVKEEVEQMDEVENAFTAYKNKRPSEIGRHLTRTHDSKRLSDTSVMYTKKHGKDLESAKDAGDAHNASVYAKQKMKKEEFDELAIEARDWEKRDKDGKVTSWGHEGDWKPVSKNKEGSGKASNNAGKALQKTKELAKEDAKAYEFDDEKPKKMTTDTLAGRVKVSKKFDNQHTSRKVELKAEEAHPDAAEDKKLISKMIKKDDEKEERKDKEKDVKLIKGLIKKDDARMHKEMTEFEHIHGEHLKVHTGPHKGREGTLDDIHGHIFEIKPHGAKSEKEHIYVPQNHTTIVHQHDEEYIPEAFHGPEAGSGTGDSPMVTNNSKPVKLAKYLAVKTADKMKKEMLGKMTN